MMMSIMMATMIAPLVWFTHHYASVIIRSSTDGISNTTHDNFDENYSQGVKEGAKLMMLFPVVSMIISAISMFFDILNKISSR